MARIAICFMFLLISTCKVFAVDAIKAEADQARVTYDKQIEAAKEKLLTAAEAKLKEYADKGDFESAKEIKGQKEAFETDGKLPSSSKLSSAKSKYEAQMRSAKAAFLRALEKAKSEYTKAQMFSEAEAINSELQKLSAGSKPPEKKPGDLLQKGSVWKGSRKFPHPGPPVPWELHVTSREGQQFTGHIETRYENAWDIAGTVQGDKVEWKVTKVAAGKGAGEPHTGTLAGNVLTVEFVAAKAAADGNRTGTGRLVLNTFGEASSPGTATSSPPPETAQSQKMPDVADFEKFLAQYDRAWDKAQQRLVQAIDNRKTEIIKSKLDGDERRRRVDVIDKDLQALKESERLPNSDDLLDAVVELIEGYQKRIEHLETMRAHWSDRAVKLKDDGAIAKLNAIEKRLDKIIGGRGQFATGSAWSGKRQTSKAALHMNLTVTNRTGTSFVGSLRQSAGGPGNLMKVEGNLDRNKVSFQITEMLRGKNRHLGFKGYLLSDRIITSVEGIQVDGKPATGWMSLWSDGGDNAQVGRRGKAAKH